MRAALAYLLLSACLLMPSLPANAKPEPSWSQRADAATDSLLDKYWDPERAYLQDAFPDNGRLTGYWTYAQGFDALLDAAERTRSPRYLDLIDRFYKGQAKRGWLVDFYDDETWMALALLRAHDLTKRREYLQQAEALFGDVQKGWDTTCCGDKPGGVWWDKRHTQKATASNAGPALAAARLYQRTRKEEYRRFAQQVYAYWWDNMVDPRTYQVTDHITPKGEKVRWRFTYNEGLMIGASVELYRATGDRAYLEKAHKVAGFMVAHETRPTAFGPVLFDGDNAGCGGDCHAFKGPGYRYLALLYREDSSKTAYRDVLKASAEALWSLARDPRTGLFAVNWAGPPMATASVAQTSAATMALNLYASLEAATPPQLTASPPRHQDTKKTLGRNDR